MPRTKLDFPDPDTPQIHVKRGEGNMAIDVADVVNRAPQ